jgi:hypothetical protein
MQQQAFQDLLVLKNANGGSLSYGDIIKVVNEYREDGWKEVDVRNMRHQMKHLANTGSMFLPCEIKMADKMKNNLEQPSPPSNTCLTVNTGDNDASVMSSLTTTRNDVVTVNVSVNHMVEGMDSTEIMVEEKVRNKGGRKTGSTNKAMDARDQALKDAITKVATKFYKARKNSDSKVGVGTLANLIKTTAVEFNVPEKISKKNYHIEVQS